MATVWEFDPAIVTGVSNGSPISGTVVAVATPGAALVFQVA